PLNVPLSVASPSVPGSAAAFISVGSAWESTEPMYPVGLNAERYDGSIVAAWVGAWKEKTSGRAGMLDGALSAIGVKAAVPGTALSRAGAEVVSRPGSSGRSDTLGAASAGPAKPRPSAAIPAAA